MHDQSDAVPRAPQHKMPRCAMPQAAEQHRDEQVGIGAHLSPPTSAEADVKVITEPRRKADVPALPELANVRGEIRQVEVDHDVEAQDARKTTGNVGVA